MPQSPVGSLPHRLCEEIELVPDAGHLPWIDACEAAARHTSGHILAHAAAPTRARAGA